MFCAVSDVRIWSFVSLAQGLAKLWKVEYLRLHVCTSKYIYIYSKINLIMLSFNITEYRVIFFISTSWIESVKCKIERMKHHIFLIIKTFSLSNLGNGYKWGEFSGFMKLYVRRPSCVAGLYTEYRLARSITAYISMLMLIDDLAWSLWT